MPYYELSRIAPKMPASKYSREMVRGFLEDWMADQDDGESLLVVYYGCHGGDDRAGSLDWAAL